jgi:hypothetical protein
MERNITMHKLFSFCFGFGLLGAIASTWVAPRVISILFTPPVSFGTNCEPAAAWATDKLISSQIAGAVVGMVLALAWLAVRKVKSPAKKDAPSTAAKPVV